MKLSNSRRLFAAVLVLCLLSPVVFAKAPYRYEYTLSYKFENRGTEDFQLTSEDVSIPLFINTTGQTVRLHGVTREYSTSFIDDDRNKGITVNIDLTLSPGVEEAFTAVYDIISSEESVPEFSFDDAEGFDEIPSSLIDEYCFSTETFQSDNPLITETAANLVNPHDSVLEAVASLVEFIVDETTYHNFETPQYPNDTLASHLGDCDDQSILLISMCRSLDIPAYLQVGIYIHSGIDDQDSNWDGHLINEAVGVAWHGWSMIYIPPWGWVPVDLTMTNADSGLDLIQSAPEYKSNIVPVMNVSKQAYIGGTLETRDRFLNSTLYVTVSDKVDTIYSPSNPLQNYLLLGIGAALLIALGLMFRFGNRE